MDARLERSTQLLRLIRIATLTAGMVWVAIMTFTDPDLWGHIRFGQDIVTTGGVSLVDRYSFTSDRAWINHEWLAELAMYAFYAASGAAGLVALKMLILTGVLGCILVALRGRHAWRPADRDFLLTVALVGMMPRATTVRPQLFSLLLFAALLLVLTTADRKPRALLALPAIFCLWANLHGAYFVGLAVLALWIAVRAWQVPRRWLPFAAVGVASVGSTLLNPYGVGLWRFLWETVGTSRLEIADWVPVYYHPNMLIPWMIVLLTACVALWRARGQVDPASLIITAVLCAAALRIGRVDAFLAIAVVMLLGPAFGRETQSATSHVRWRPWVASTAAVILFVPPVAFAKQAACLDLEGPKPGLLSGILKLPSPYTGVPEREAASVLRNQRGRLLTYFDWGEYAIWHFPQLKVSIDGRRETVYSDDLYQAHGRLYRGLSTDVVKRLRPDLIWLPVRLPAVTLLEQQGWRAIFRGPVSVVLVPGTSSWTQQENQSWTEAKRCFPAE